MPITLTYTLLTIITLLVFALYLYIAIKDVEYKQELKILKVMGVLVLIAGIIILIH